MNILVTGSAGFIGANLVLKLINTESHIVVVGLDNMDDYYDVQLKEYRLAKIEESAKEHHDNEYVFIKGSISDRSLLNRIFDQYHIDYVVNLAAQAGVRYSIDHPDVYIESNIVGFYNVLETCRRYSVRHLVFASSSSVYGDNTKIPFSEDDKVDTPISLYGATKKADELIAYSYNKLYGIPTTGLRFFTVYGPAGRPDMAYFGFTNKLIKGETIQIFNYGNCKRDFTFIDDIVEGIQRVIHKPQGYAIYNIGNSQPENLLDFIQILQEELIKAKVLPEDYNFELHKQLIPMQDGDLSVTYADTSKLQHDFGFKPHTPLREGLRQFAKWYGAFYCTE